MLKDWMYNPNIVFFPVINADTLLTRKEQELNG